MFEIHNTSVLVSLHQSYKANRFARIKSRFLLILNNHYLALNGIKPICKVFVGNCKIEFFLKQWQHSDYRLRY